VSAGEIMPITWGTHDAGEGFETTVYYQAEKDELSLSIGNAFGAWASRVFEFYAPRPPRPWWHVMRWPW
jgi:hypothetical protein